MDAILVYIAVGFVAQLIDGALGMAFGIIAMSALLGMGLSPAVASASVHLAEIFTTGLSGLSHVYHRNVDWRLFVRLAVPGSLGAALGAFLLTRISGEVIRPFIALYLLAMGAVILVRAFSRMQSRAGAPPAARLGFAGGFLDALGGGWGPVVASSLLAWGAAPRFALGSGNLAEFFVCLSASAVFVAALDFDYLVPVFGLMIGGALSAPLAGFLVKRLSPRPIMFAVSFLVFGISLYVLWQAVLPHDHATRPGPGPGPAAMPASGLVSPAR